MFWYVPKRLSTHSREKRKLYERCVIGACTDAGAGAGADGDGDAATTAGFSAVSGVGFDAGALLAFSLSFRFDIDAFGFAVCFELPPNTLFKMFHFPLLVSSSGKSCKSVDKEEVGRTASGSGGTGLVGEGLR
jgi:hypothetical protein